IRPASARHGAIGPLPPGSPGVATGQRGMGAGLIDKDQARGIASKEATWMRKAARRPSSRSLATEGKGCGLILPLHNARRFMRVGVFFYLGNLPVAAVVDPAILILVLLAGA